MSWFKPPIPKEHGTWVMFIVPLILGSILAPVKTPALWVLYAAAFSFYLLRHPLAMLVRLRKRQNATQRRYWQQWAVIYGLLTIAFGGWLVLGQQLWWLLPMGLAGTALLGYYLWLLARHQHMSVAGEIWGIAGLALGAPMAYYAADGYVDVTAALLWFVNAVYFSGTVFYIKLKVRLQPKMPQPATLLGRLKVGGLTVGYHLGSLAVFTVLSVVVNAAPHWLPVILLPATLKALHGAATWQDKKTLSLVRLGVIEIIHSILFTLLVVVVFGGGG